MLMDKSQEKMQTQHEQIEKQEAEIQQLKEENIAAKSELQLQQVYFKRILE